MSTGGSRMDHETLEDPETGRTATMSHATTDETKTPRIAVYPGSFDPLHNGHLDIIERCCPIFDEVIVAVLRNTSKNPLFSVDERVELITEAVGHLDNCRVESFTGLLVHFMDQVGSQIIIRGLRAVSDFESEFQMALMNRHLDPRMVAPDRGLHPSVSLAGKTRNEQSNKSRHQDVWRTKRHPSPLPRSSGKGQVIVRTGS